MIDSSAWYVLHRPTDRISGAFSSPDSAIAGAKTLGSRTAKFQQIGGFSGRPLFATKTGWLVVPGSYVVALHNTGNMPRSEFEATTAARRSIEHTKNRSGVVPITRIPASYTHLVIDANGRVMSGWEYAQDAKDDLRDNGMLYGPGARVVSKRFYQSRIKGGR